MKFRLPSTVLRQGCNTLQAAGGAVHVLNGNHETMNVGGRYTYATAGAVQDYERWQRIQQTGAKLRVSRGDINLPCAPRFCMLRRLRALLRLSSLHLQCWSARDNDAVLDSARSRRCAVI